MAFKLTTFTKSMAATLFKIIAITAFTSTATGLAQSPESDRLVDQCISKISSRCAMYVTAEMYVHGPLKNKMDVV